MREIILATLLAGILVPGAVSAQSDGGLPDGSAYASPTPTDDQPSGGHTGNSLDPNGNMGDVGRTGRDGGASGASDAATGGGEGSTGSQGSSSAHPVRSGHAKPRQSAPPSHSHGPKAVANR